MKLLLALGGLLGAQAIGNIHEARRLADLTKEEFCDELHKAITALPQHQNDDDEYTDKYCHYIIEEHELEKDDYNDVKDIPYFLKHYKIYKKNEKEIEQCNKQAKKWVDHGLELNEHCGDSRFSDKDDEQLKKMFLNEDNVNENARRLGSTSSCNILPNNYFDGVDNQKGNNKASVCGPARDQKVSNACWAFASAEMATCNFNNQKAKSISFSEQQVLDCTTDDIGTQRNGGWPSYVSNFMSSTSNKGFCSSFNYKFVEGGTDYNGYCKCNVPLEAGTCYGFRADDFTRVTKAVAAGQQYYWTIVMYVDSHWFNAKKSAGFTGNVLSNACHTGGNKYLHAMNVVGQWYGNYLYIQNSWGTDWGENGFIWIKKDVFVNCIYKVDNAPKMNYIFMNYFYVEKGYSAKDPLLPLDNSNNAIDPELPLDNNANKFENIFTQKNNENKLYELSYISIGIIIGMIFGGLCVALACGLMIYCIFIKNKVKTPKYNVIMNDSDTDEEV